MSGQTVLRRTVQMLLTIVLLSGVVFALARLTGDPVLLMVPPEATDAEVADMRAYLGLDRPLLVQYWLFVSNAVTGDFGTSVKWNQPVLPMILERVPATALLALTSMVLALLVALPLGIAAAVWRDSWIDNFGKVIALIGQSMPTFWFGILLILILALYYPIFPTSGFGTVSHLVLPTITLGTFIAAGIMRVTRSAMLDALHADYIRTARSKGAPEWRVIMVHALKNASIPILTITALQAATILRGTVVTETIFSWPGIGKLAVDAVYSRDFPMVQAAVLFMGGIFIAINFIVDLVYVLLDPRISYERADAQGE